MIYYQSLQWLPKSDNKIIKKIKKNPKLCLNHSLINCRLDTEDDILLSNILHQNKKKLDAPNLKKINLNIISGSNISFMVK